VLYTSFHSLDEEVILCIFDYYRLNEEQRWNFQHRWRGLSHICRRWRYLAYGSVFRLDMHILCTNGSPLVGTLPHLSHVPLIIDYKDTNATVGAQDETGMFHALQQRHRVRSVVLHISPPNLRYLLSLMEGIFPILERLSLSHPAEGTAPILPETFLAPNLNHLTLVGVSLIRESSLLSSAHSLVTFTLNDIKDIDQHSSTHLLTLLRSCPQLEELSIGFCPMSLPDAARTLPWPRVTLSREIYAVTLPNLKQLTFQGVSAFLEDLLAHVRAPHLEQLGITLFNQLTFRLPNLSYFTNIIEGLRHPSTAKVTFEADAVTVVTDHRQKLINGPPLFSLRVGCKHFDWQISAVTQLCDTLTTMLSGVECLALELDGPRTELKGDPIDSEMWTQLLMFFSGTKELRICHALVEELSLALQPDDEEPNLELLPELQELALEIEEEHADDAFASFMNARQLAERPVRLLPLPVPGTKPVPGAQPVPSQQPDRPE
jgi:hypothetical protein